MGEEIVRFGVSVEQGLLARFDELIAARGYTNRSEALRDLMREQLLAATWAADGEAERVGAITLVYDHEVRELGDKLLDLQHTYQEEIISVLHVHLDHRHCLEVVVVRGPAARLEELAGRLLSHRGVKHGRLTMTGIPPEE